MKFTIPFGTVDRIDPISAYQPYFTRIKSWLGMDMPTRQGEFLPAAGCRNATAGKEPMGRKDVAGKAFFSDYERFAELVNVNLYCGRKILIPENLQRIERSYPALAGAYGEKNRDILMEDIGQKIHIGMELETASDYSMPERVMVYDACEYEQQIRQIHRRHRQDGDYADYREKKSRMKKKDCLCRTVTFVMYLGEGHWEGKRRLSEMFYPSGQNMVFMTEDWQDYSFILLEADFLNPADYKTDLKEFFQAMQCRRD